MLTYSQQHMLDHTLIVCGLVSLLFTSLLYQRLLRTPPWITPTLAFGVIVAQCLYLRLTDAATIGGVLNENQYGRDAAQISVALKVFAAYITGTLIAGLCIKVYLAFLGKGRADELAPGTAAIRTWIRPFHATLVVILAFAARFSIGWSIPMGLFVGTALLLVYPVITALTRSNPVPTETVNESEERERVLKLVEDGKITADDAAELISALGQSRTRADRAPLASGPMRPLVWVGAGLVALSFVMPWFELNIADELRRVMNNAGGIVPNPAAPPGFLPESLPRGIPANIAEGVTNLSLKIYGPDLQLGLGWIILLAAVTAALLPLLWAPTPLNRPSQRGITLALAIAGSLFLFYTLATGLRSASIGAFVAVAGYVVLWIGIAREFSLGRARQPALA